MGPDVLRESFVGLKDFLVKVLSANDINYEKGPPGVSTVVGVTKVYSLSEALILS